MPTASNSRTAHAPTAGQARPATSRGRQAASGPQRWRHGHLSPAALFAPTVLTFWRFDVLTFLWRPRRSYRSTGRHPSWGDFHEARLTPADCNLALVKDLRRSACLRKCAQNAAKHPRDRREAHDLRAGRRQTVANTPNAGAPPALSLRPSCGMPLRPELFPNTPAGLGPPRSRQPPVPWWSGQPDDYRGRSARWSIVFRRT